MSADLNQSTWPAPEPTTSRSVTDEPSDPARRRALLAATTALGGIGVAAATAPFIASMLPSEKAKAAGAPVEVDLTWIEKGTLLTVEWQGKPVWVLHRTDEMLRLLAKGDPQLSDPLSNVPQQPSCCNNPTRSINPEFFVAVGICTHLGCVPSFRPEIAPVDLGPEWRGGFYCPCHGSRFDLAGRVYKNVPAPTNLVVPPYRFLSDSRLVIGESVK